MAVLDASVVTAFFLESDAHHARATRWRDTVVSPDEPWNVPTILLAELAASISRQTGSVQLANRVLTQFHLLDDVKVFEVGHYLAGSSATIAAAQRIKGCDAIYVALAAELDDVLVTFDQEQADRAAPVVRVLVPE